MFLVKIKPLGWVIVLVVLIAAVGVGAALSRRSAKPANASAGVANSPAAIPGSFATEGKFAHVGATNPDVKNAIAADDLDTGEKMVDKTVRITGKVVRVYVTKSKSITFLNFDENYKNAFTVMIQSKDYGKFPDPSVLEGKPVVVTGKVTVYEGKLEIVADSPDQIKIVDSTKPAPRN